MIRLAAAALFCLSVTPVAADCRGVVLRQRVVHHAAVVQQVVQPVVAVQPYQVAVPVAVPVQGTYYQVGSQIRDQAAQELIAQRVMQLLAPQLQQMQSLFVQAQQVPFTQPPPQQFVSPPAAQAPAQAPMQPPAAAPVQPTCPMQPQAPTAPVQPVPLPQPGPTTDTCDLILAPPGPVTDAAYAYIKTACLSCHNTSKPSKGYDFSTPELMTKYSAQIISVTHDKSMPKNGPATTDDEFGTLFSWFRSIKRKMP